MFGDDSTRRRIANSYGVWLDAGCNMEKAEGGRRSGTRYATSGTLDCGRHELRERLAASCAGIYERVGRGRILRGLGERIG